MVAVGCHARADRLVHGADALRTVGAARRRHGHAGLLVVRPRAATIRRPPAGLDGVDPGPGRSDVGVVGGILAVDGRHRRGLHHRATAVRTTAWSPLATRPAGRHTRRPGRCRAAQLARVPSPAVGVVAGQPARRAGCRIRDAVRHTRRAVVGAPRSDRAAADGSLRGRYAMGCHGRVSRHLAPNPHRGRPPSDG